VKQEGQKLQRGTTDKKKKNVPCGGTRGFVGGRTRDHETGDASIPLWVWVSGFGPSCKGNSRKKGRTTARENKTGPDIKGLWKRTSSSLYMKQSEKKKG